MKIVSFIAILSGFIAVTLTETAGGQEPPDDPAVESARNVFRQRVKFPWYDTDRDSIKRLDVEPPEDLENRFSKWEAMPTGSMPAWMVTGLRLLGWTLVAVALVLTVFLLMRALLWSEVAGATVGRADTSQAKSARGVIERVGKLPFPLQLDQTDLLGEAHRCFEAGNYGQAIIYLYSYQLVQLDKHQLIRLAKGKTNRQYLFEMKGRPGLRELLETTMIAFEDVFFGHRSLDRARFEHCWHAMDNFHQQLDQMELSVS